MTAFATLREIMRTWLPAEIRPWLWCGFFSLVFVALFALATKTVAIPMPMAYYNYNHARLTAFAASRDKDDTRKRVILIGSSQLKYATELPEDTPDRPSPWAQMKTLRLARNLAVMTDFRPLLDEVLALKPDIIVLQLPLAGVERRIPYERFLGLRNYLKSIAFGVGPWNMDDEAQFEQQFAKPCAGDHSRRELEYRIGRYHNITYIDPNGRNAALARWFIGAATARGIKVFVVAVPGSAPMNAVIPMWNPRIVDDLLLHFATDPKVTLARYPGDLPDAMFCDSMHLADAGRARYSDWLAHLLQ